ncbi:hypothetical protein Desti_3678 [Desulfomonile tiedjei DSM 6799]|uniref:Uncharacterized protein n=1 Tax=Desulfomonile tiedjei (strain ATCC 49306 / DSM 6799 / DCB-1) TaxID=706587 RepID=I4C9T2_DESTA|nr:hypothetical protein Desti_3678 [Desulfomonile tiedjei DSM 6799]
MVPDTLVAVAEQILIRFSVHNRKALLKNWWVPASVPAHLQNKSTSSVRQRLRTLPAFVKGGTFKTSEIMSADIGLACYSFLLFFPIPPVAGSRLKRAVVFVVECFVQILF